MTWAPVFSTPVAASIGVPDAWLGARRGTLVSGGGEPAR